MANRFPLIFNPSANQIQELSENDNLDLTLSGIIGVTNISAAGIITATDFNSASDINLKENIRPIENPLDKVLQINGVEFDWKDNQQSSMGVIAQEVEKVFPELVKTAENKSVNYNGLVGVLIEAVKEQQKQINILKKRIENLENQN
jgi:hypothetical protein